MRRLKVLWVSHFVPYPPKGGAFQRSFNLLRGAGETHEIHLVALRHKASTHPESETLSAADALKRHCESVTIVDGTATTSGSGILLRGLRLALGVPLTASVSETSEMRAAIHAVTQRIDFDIVHLDTIGLACYLNDVGHVPCVLTHHGAESFMMVRRTRRESNWAKKVAFLIEGRILRRYEARHCPRVAANLVVSDFDRQLLSEVAPAAHFEVIPNGVDTAYFHAMAPVADRRLIFAGRLDQYSNRDAILHFVHDTWPGIKQRFPDAVFDVLGSNPPAELRHLAESDPALHVHGFVPDVRPYFERAAVAVCPIRDGGGTRVKILDNLAMAKPIVSTTIATEGIDVVPDRDLLIADDPLSFINAVSRLFTDDALRRSLSTNARLLAEQRYSWESIVSKLLAAYERALSPAVQETG
jgi:glycosyltransferase involved in cell wall biosynthesis